ncbi:MAG: HD-GYP domain-containing protein [Gammaproteobacteria bacterium]|nr:HD-GYP domain-containing protein [Gammaproteobacteria bacterium]
MAMKKRIRSDQLKPGMYVSDLDCSWMEHSFLRNNFMVKDRETIHQIIKEGIKQLYIDPERGLDVEDAPTVAEVSDRIDAEMIEVVKDLSGTQPRSVEQERQQAQKVFTQAQSVVKTLMQDIRVGKQIDASDVEPIASDMMGSVFRNPHALTSISRIKTKDEYTFMHSVSVAALSIAFARCQGMDQTTILEIGKGALLHDIGKIMTPQEVLNKPGKLTDDEFLVMKNHVVISGEILRETSGISKIALEAVTMHHERIDGTGYPLKLKGDAITHIGQMSAIVDVYDALTSVRIYKSAWEPTLTLKKMMEWTPSHFDATLVQQFIRCLGIYPVGTMVELKSNHLAIVIEAGENLLKPTVMVFYSVKGHHYVNMQRVDLAKSANNGVVKAVSAADYDINPRIYTEILGM